MARTLSDIGSCLPQFLSTSNNEHAAIGEELERWQRQYVDVESLYRQLQQERDHSARLQASRDTLKDDIKVRGGVTSEEV